MNGDNAAGEIAVGDRAKPAASIIALKSLLPGKGADALDEIAIGLAIAGHHLADGGNDVNE